ncbi:glycoside hydrolase family 43 protein [Streptomyces phytohabitans]|uniref:glycoside hydrolase family 43 protein n=1 Tax=Streptomyces phytohabitans TaxID=1150371 RepID=UPI00345BB310
MRRLRACSAALAAALLLGLPAAATADSTAPADPSAASDTRADARTDNVASAAPVRTGTAADLDYTTAEAGNPLVDGWYADPDLARYGDTYWMYPTTSRPYDEQTYLDAFSSTDLVHWTKHAKVLDIADVPWAKRALWAPAPVERDGRYYLYFGANDIQDDSEVGGIGVAVADRPEGPYEDALGEPLIGAFHNGAQPIDQDVFIDDDGQAYLYYGGHGHANVVKLNDDMTSLGTFEDGTTFREITPENYTEGSLMFQRDGTYYLMWSEGGWTGPDYSVSYATADSPTGPFRKVGRVLEQDPSVARGSGHNSVVNVPGTDIWYLFYHRRPLSETDGNHRALAYERMEFTDDGAIRPVTMKVRDNFDDGNTVGWKPHGDAAWNAEGDALTGTSASAGLTLQDTDFADLAYEGDVTLAQEGAEAGLVFRTGDGGSGPDGFRGYSATLTTDAVTLSASDADGRTTLATAPLDVAAGERHRVRVEAVGTDLRVYVDDLAEPVVSVTDDAHTTGGDGVRVGAGDGTDPARPLAAFDDLAVEPLGAGRH